MADTKGLVNDGQLHQLLETGEETTHISENLRVLALDNDVDCLTILASKLRKCGYEVTTTTEASEALELLKKNRDDYDIVIIDVFIHDIDGFKLLEIIGHEWDIPVIMTSADNNLRTVEKCIKLGARDYLLKPVQIEILQNIWQHVMRKMVYNPQSNALETDQTNGNSNPNTQLHDEDVSSQSTKESLPQKKPRLVWDHALHQKFLDVIERIDIKKAVPKKILELMNEPNLTRENIASHLQKHRNFLKKVEERAAAVEMEKSTHMDGMLHLYNPMILQAAVGNHDLTSNNPPFLPFNYSNIMLQQNHLLSEDANQRWKNMAIPVLQNVAPGTSFNAGLGSGAINYQTIQNQRNMVDCNFGQISSHLTASGVGPRYLESIPSSIVGNHYSSGLPMINDNPYAYSLVPFNPVVPLQAGYTQPFLASSSVGRNNGYEVQTFPATTSIRENNGTLALPFPSGSAVIENNDIHLEQPLPAVGSIQENNIGNHTQIFPTGSFVSDNIYGHLELPSSTDSSIIIDNGHHAQPFIADSSVSHHAQPSVADSSVSHHPQALPTDDFVPENNELEKQPFPSNSTCENNNPNEMEVELDCSFDEDFNFMVEQFTDYSSPSIL